MTLASPASPSPDPLPAPDPAGSPLPQVLVYCNGDLLPQDIPLQSLWVESTRGAASGAQLELLDSVLADDRAARPPSPLALGASVRIDLGREQAPATVFEGRVVGQRLAVQLDGSTRLFIECRQPVSPEAATEVADAARTEPALELRCGVNLIDFEGWIGEAAVEAGAGLEPASTQAGGHAACEGSAAASVGAWIAFAGLGAPFDGPQRLAGVRHVVRQGRWITEYAFGELRPAAAPWPATRPLATPGSHRIAFDDGGNTLRITTPAGQTAVLSDEDHAIRLQDASGNRVELTRAGLQLFSPNDITLSARGDIRLDAVGALVIKSAMDVKLQGVNVACEAAMAFVAKGAASAELSASGQTSVKGAMVMIN